MTSTTLAAAAHSRISPGLVISIAYVAEAMYENIKRGRPAGVERCPISAPRQRPSSAILGVPIRGLAICSTRCDPA